MKTMAFSNLIGSIIFLAIGIWAWFQTGNFPEVANTYVQASTFPRVMIVGVVIFSVILLLQSIFKLMGTMKEGVKMRFSASGDLEKPYVFEQEVVGIGGGKPCKALQIEFFKPCGKGYLDTL